MFLWLWNPSRLCPTTPDSQTGSLQGSELFPPPQLMRRALDITLVIAKDLQSQCIGALPFPFHLCFSFQMSSSAGEVFSLSVASEQLARGRLGPLLVQCSLEDTSVPQRKAVWHPLHSYPEPGFMPCPPCHSSLWFALPKFRALTRLHR